jgi:hypothetical protein
MPPGDDPKFGARPDLAALAASVDRVGKIQLVIVGLLTLTLVAIPLYLWQRPRAVESVHDVSRPLVTAEQAAAAPAANVAGARDAGASANGLSLSEMVIVSCHDPGTKKTAPQDCDRLPALESAFVAAIVKRADCVPASAGAGTIQYEADIGFARARNKIAILVPRDGRTLKSPKMVLACAAAVKKELAGTSLDVPHAHARYKIAVTASYPGPSGTAR